MFDEVILKYNIITHDVNGSSRPLRASALPGDRHRRSFSEDACASIFSQRFVLENIPYSRRRMAIDAIA